jgi:putative integral membrane protein (TIGR02587 family)
MLVAVIRSNHVKKQSRFVTALGRAFGGAFIFALPLLMTMELWWLGFYISRLRLALLLALLIPFLTLLSHYRGYETTAGWIDDVRDAFVACAVAFGAAAIVLWLFGIVDWTTPLDETVGKLALQVIPGSIGALLARSQLGDRDEQEGETKESYGFEIFLMATGGLFLSLNIAPTEEVNVIALSMSAWRVLILVGLSLASMHAFVYFLEFRGGHEIPEQASGFGLFVRYTVVGYAVCLLASLYVLWTFGRTDGQAMQHVLTMAMVLSFPASIGAAAARLIL